MNLVQPGSFLTLHYRLSGPDGADVINTFGAKPATLSLGAGQLAPAIEQRLIGLAEGAHRRFDLAPGEAFGEREPAPINSCRTNQPASTQAARNQPMVTKMNGGGSASSTRARGYSSM